MVEPSDPALTAEQRLTQIAAILARGVRRYQQLLQRSESRPGKEVPKSSSNCLEVIPNPRLSVSRRTGV
jgi:hypothetical protein